MIGDAKIFKASILMMVSLFFPLMWNLIPIEVIWTFPFFDIALNKFSLNPTETVSRPVQTIAPFYFCFVLSPLYIYCRGLVPEMKYGKINIWTIHFIYTSIQAVDLFMAYCKLPYYRTAFIFFGLLVHLLYWRDSSKQVET